MSTQHPQLNTPAVSPGEVNIDVVGMEARRAGKMAAYIAILPENSITNTELGLATVRLANATVQAAGGDIAPPWFGQAIEPILTQMIEMNNSFTQMENRLNDLQEQANVSQAMIVNAQKYEQNRRAFQTGPRPSYVRLAKTNQGFMTNPPIAAMVPTMIPEPIANIFTALPPSPGPNTIPPSEIPFLDDTNRNLTQAQIGYLAKWYNNDFGIVNGDDHGVQIEKLQKYLCGWV